MGNQLLSLAGSCPGRIYDDISVFVGSILSEKPELSCALCSMEVMDFKLKWSKVSAGFWESPFGPLVVVSLAVGFVEFQGFPSFLNCTWRDRSKCFMLVLNISQVRGQNPLLVWGQGCRPGCHNFSCLFHQSKLSKNNHFGSFQGFGDGWRLHTRTVFLRLTLFWSKQGDLRCFALHPPPPPPPLGGLQQVASLVRIYGQVLLVQCKQTKFYGANTERSWTLRFDCTMTEKHGFIYPVVPVRCLQEFHFFFPGTLTPWRHEKQSHPFIYSPLNLYIWCYREILRNQS